MNKQLPRTERISRALLMLAIGIKLFFFFFVDYNLYHKQELISIQPFPHRPVYYDDCDAANVALQVVNEGKYLRAQINDSGQLYYHKTSYRPVFAVYLHAAGIALYNCFASAPLTGKDIYHWENPGSNSNYYRIYSWVLNTAALLLFLFSLTAYSRLMGLCGIVRPELRHLGLVLYILYPSTLVFVGSLTLNENLALPALVIFSESVCRVLICGLPESRTRLAGNTILVVLASLLRPQLVLPLFIIMAFSVLVRLIRYLQFRERPGRSARFLILFVFFSMLTTHSAVILHNKYLVWGEPVYVTRGDGLFWGHNPLARGCWDGTTDTKGSPLYIYQHEHIPGLLQMSELEKSGAYSKLAKEWVFKNPVKELVLTARKVAIFFLPYNFEYLYFSPLVFLAHLATFLLFGLVICYACIERNWLRFTGTDCFILVVIISVLFINVLYFVEYRVRYFAEPFMVLCISLVLRHLFSNNRGVAA